MIKDIYFYWGNETISYMRYMTLYSFRILNPDWRIFLIKNTLSTDRELKLRTKERQDKTEYKGKDYSKLIDGLDLNIIEFKLDMVDLAKEVVVAMSDVHIKDLLNWKLLAEKGGAVADMDILFVREITNQIKPNTDIGLVCFKNFPKKDYIPVSFIYGRPNDFFKNVYRNALKNYKSYVYESCGTPAIIPETFPEIKEMYLDLNIQQLDDEIVFPFVKYPWYQGLEMLYIGDYTNEIPGNTIGIHWYAGAPISQLNNNLINDISVNKINNTITRVMRRLLCQNPNSL